jgi:hypothetical protein
MHKSLDQTIEREKDSNVFLTIYTENTDIPEVSSL